MTSIHHIPLDESGAGWESFVAQLPEAEQERAMRFHFDADRLRFAKCRALLRQRLGELLEIPPIELRFRFGDHDKPFLDHDTDLEFNLSHTRGGALIAITRGAEVGVDIENIHRMPDIDGVARKVFTEREREHLLSLNGAEKQRQFFRLWTAKEAYLKATGQGLSLDPATIEAHLPSKASLHGHFESIASSPLEPWVCVELDLDAPFVAMLCATSPDFEIEQA